MQLRSDQTLFAEADTGLNFALRLKFNDPWARERKRVNARIRVQKKNVALGTGISFTLNG